LSGSGTHEILIAVMRAWLRGRRNALTDAALAYAVIEWLLPSLVSAVLTLGSTVTGLMLLISIAYPFVLVGEVMLLDRLGIPMPTTLGYGPPMFGPSFGRRYY
jgi:hypothetical protein